MDTGRDAVRSDLELPYPGQFGFGALRCSIDNLNGDNVEWIAYPQGTEHVFCYAYYVRPPPTSGTIVIRKEVRGTPGATQTFTFDGNLSFNEGNLFNLRVSNGQPASQSFYRAETGADDEPWVVHEQVPAGWRLAQLSCSTAAGSVVATDVAGARAAIRLAPGDTVTCTYVNEVHTPAGELFIRKLTRGGIGSFDFDVMPVGGGAGAEAHAETQQERVAVDAQPSPLTLSPGTYRIDEHLPESRAGRWRLDNVICGGLLAADSESTEVTITDGGGATCTFENSFVPSGKIAIDKVTLGGVTTTGFVIPPWEIQTPSTGRRPRPASPAWQLERTARIPTPCRWARTSSRNWSRLPTRIATGRSSRWFATGGSFPPLRDAWSSRSPATIRAGCVASPTPSARPRSRRSRLARARPGPGPLPPRFRARTSSSPSALKA